MAKKQKDEYSSLIEQILSARYKPAHPKAKIKAYRYNSASVRIRVIDPDFAGKIIPEREAEVWAILDTLPEEVRTDITVLLLVTPEESRQSLMSMEFDNPTPSRL
jgi:hypothetical protein